MANDEQARRGHSRSISPGDKAMAQTLPLDARLEAANEFIRSLPGGECDCRPFFVGADDRGVLVDIPALLRGPKWLVRGQHAAIEDEIPFVVYAPDARAAAGLVRFCAQDYFDDAEADAHVGDPVRVSVQPYPPYCDTESEMFDTAMVPAWRALPEAEVHVDAERGLRAEIFPPGAELNCDVVLDGFVYVESLDVDGRPGTARINRHGAKPRDIAYVLNHWAATTLRKGDIERAKLYAEAAAWVVSLIGWQGAPVAQEVTL
jgi:hypothetical protein